MNTEFVNVTRQEAIQLKCVQQSHYFLKPASFGARHFRASMSDSNQHKYIDCCEDRAHITAADLSGLGSNRATQLAGTSNDAQWRKCLQHMRGRHCSDTKRPVT